MKKIRGVTAFGPMVLAAFALSACGGSAPPPKSQDEEVEDIYDDLTKGVELDEEEVDEQGEVVEEYTGPTKATVNLKVVTEKNPKGSTFKLIDANGSTIIEKGALGEPTELNQGVYSLEFTTKSVFGQPTYLVEDVEVAGKEQTLDNVFPAGQITLHTFRGKNEGRCVPTKFTVKSETLDKKLDGKGKTCEPLILETGSYELELELSRKKVQPVKLQINREQVSSAKVKLEK